MNLIFTLNDALKFPVFFKKIKNILGGKFEFIVRPDFKSPFRLREEEEEKEKKERRKMLEKE